MIYNYRFLIPYFFPAAIKTNLISIDSAAATASGNAAFTTAANAIGSLFTSYSGVRAPAVTFVSRMDTIDANTIGWDNVTQTYYPPIKALVDSMEAMRSATPSAATLSTGGSGLDLCKTSIVAAGANSGTLQTNLQTLATKITSPAGTAYPTGGNTAFTALQSYTTSLL